MDFKQYSTPEQLERNSFLWSEARLAIAAVALFLGGIPPVVYFLDTSSAIWGVLKVAWIISGAAAGYLAWRWTKSGQTVFGGKDNKDLAAFAVSVISGLNLGWTGLTGNNIGMGIAAGNQVVYVVAGAIYLVAAVHLWRRWKARGERVF